MSQMTREQSVIITGSLMLLASIAGAFALYWTSALMVPLVLSILVYYLVGPLVDVLQRRLRAPQWLAILAAMVTIGVGATLLTLLLWSSALGLADNATLYEERVAALASEVLGLTRYLPPKWVPEGLDTASIQPELVLESLDLASVMSTLGTGAGNLLGFLSNLVSNAVLVILFSVYLISGRTTGAVHQGLWAEVDEKIRSYLVTKFVLSAATGVLTWILLALLGLDLALVFGVLAFLLNFIPSIGSIIATLLPIPIALIQFDSLGAVAAVVLLPGTVQFTIGNVIEPRVMGQSLDLHPITVLLTLIFWTLLWGAVGALLAVPITAVGKIVLERFETTRPIATLLAGRLGDLPGV